MTDIDGNEFKDWLIGIRRDLHMYPETAYQEVRTTERIKSVLDELGIETRTFEDITGVVGLIGNPDRGRTVALRADIDALPIDELNEVDYRSRHEGRMHACGHDASTTIMLGVARRLAESGQAERLKGAVKFLFQPAEEGGAGARAMIERGVLEDPSVDWIMAGHMFPEMELNTVGIYRAQSHASTDTFTLEIEGKGGHGAKPHQGVDPVVAAGNFISAIQTVVSRSVDPLETAVISIGRIEGGRAANVIPQKVKIMGTIRALDVTVRQHLHQRLQEIVAGLETMFGVVCSLDLGDGYPPCINDSQVSAFLYKVAADIVGEDRVTYLQPTTGGEDFAFFALEKPAAIIRLGCSNESKGLTFPLHSPRFDVDEDVLTVGVDVFTEAVLRFLKSSE